MMAVLLGGLIVGVVPAREGPDVAESTTRAPDGVEIRYTVQGQGEPALVFVHCWACDRHLWDASLERFKGRRRVVALDLAGHGDSGRNRKDWTIAAFGGDVAAVVEAEKLDRVVLIGHSMGGPVILEAAKRLGSRVVGLVPVDTLLNVEEHMSPEDRERYLAPFEADFPKAAEEFLRGYMFTPTSDPKLVARLVAKTQAMPSDIAVALLRQSWSYDEQAGLEAMKVPVVAVNADKFPTNVEANRRHSPGYTALYVRGVGHYLMLEAPEVFGLRLEAALAAFAP